MTRPQALGFSPARLARIDRFLEEKYLASGRLPFVHLQVTRGGERVHETVQGLADRERGRAATREGVHRIYSMTKPITSLAFMMLVEEGKVALDDPVSRFIPEWKDLAVFSAGTGPYLTTPPARPMQMVDLLRHTSGLTYGFQTRTNVDAAYRKLKIADAHGPLDMPGFVDTLARLPLEFSPGEAWNYSVSTDVLGVLVERISGQRFQDFLAERILAPLGMTETGFSVRADQAKRFSACYAPTPEGGLTLQDDPVTSAYHQTPRFHSGGGGLVSTADDYMKFCRMLVNHGELNGHRLIAPATLRLMASNHLPGGQDLTMLSRSLFSEATNAGVGFGLGFAVTFDPVRAMLTSSPGEYYWGGAASTAFWIDPVKDIAVVFLTQLMGSSTYPIRRELRTLVYAALMEP
ncbi:MAG: beta-lactamase family protein [Phenylobacterium sp.]|uniref:serine hydrolase domain-containing protein n=1 Tax=Phenylobacterium sp. TaxID=1871053 RepID=UPI0025FE039C|nr:serine hydrolase domain-containing protein [Phenylobacterium sp.]MCA3730360.1 beta-lactamase family protein [Phenylobacterium sp.]MCA3746340.1 beta-lactamase family protein [Phenylobacterium sp.]MCA3749922.1 beta-lactamase family protein [Phenylobacterium sp.]MCA6237227.1 beta-lactamase family protein [Phenylobacterium sp.]MCA6244376.1 beta-lactamase family protein [Phenylobacterium sp.]